MGPAVRGAWYLWRGTARGTGRAILVVALIGGLLGAVALAALAGARRTDTAYGRYLTASNASEALVNIPGALPGMPLLRPIQQISALPGIASSAAYIGLSAYPVVHGQLRPSFLFNGVNASLDGLYFRQDKMTILAGRLPPLRATRQIVITPGLARHFGVGVGGTMTYRFVSPRTGLAPTITRSFRVAAIALIPPVLVDTADAAEGAVLPPGATRQLLPYYQYAWVNARLSHGDAGITALQGELARLVATLEPQIEAATHHHAVLSFPIGRADIVQAQVQQSIRPQVVALTVFGAIAALATVVLVGQGLMQLLSRSAAGLQAMRAVGVTRGQAALATALPGILAVTGGSVLAVAGAVALSPLAPVGPVRRFDPVRGMQLDGLVLGAGTAVLLAVLLSLLALMARRAIRPARGAANRRPSAVAQLAAATGLPPCAVVGSRNALETEPTGRTVPAWVTLIGSVAAVTAVVITAVFGASLAGLISHPRQYGWNWAVLIQAEGGYGTFRPGLINKLVGRQPAVTAWSSFGFSQLPVGGREIPVLGLQRRRGSVEPPTASGRPLAGSGEIELGAITMHQLGKAIGDTVQVGIPRYRRSFTIVGTVTLPSFGVQGTQHVSLGQGAMLSHQDLLRAQGFKPGDESQAGIGAATSVDSAVAMDLAPGTSPQQRARLVREITSANPDRTAGGSYELGQARAAAIANTSGMGGQPLALALGLAVAAVLSLALTVLASVRRRRRELALLKTLGMTRHQLRSIVAWQTTVTLALTALISIPLGIAFGRWAWEAFAGSLGVVPTTVIPAPALLAGLAGLLAAGNLLSLLPASVAARTPAAATLRAD
jgi:ABC-type lipoprotein release transport system permease subunit